MKSAPEREPRRYRHEIKYLCSFEAMTYVSMRIRSVMERDGHADESGGYLIRSIYFDDLSDSGLRDTIDGTQPRYKWRIRAYNCDDSLIQLEKKSKEDGMCSKQSCRIDRSLFEDIMAGKRVPVEEGMPPLLPIFLAERQEKYLEPKVLVQYRRYPYIYRSGNVRVTFDCDIASSNAFSGFFTRQIPVRPIMPTGMRLMEVKWDGFLADHLYHLLSCQDMLRVTYSKYQLCRKYTL